MRESIEQAARALADRCTVMGAMVERLGPPAFRWGRPKDPFAALARAICFQQLATKAATAIYGRVETMCGGEPTPQALLRRRTATLRACGLSGSKTASLQDLARRVDRGEVELERFPRMKDEAIVEQLVVVRGIGEWTAQMHLIFHLGRRDVWPALDYGVRKGYALAYGLRELPTPKQLLPLGERFAPYRSLAAWYCWRATDGKAK